MNLQIFERPPKFNQGAPSMYVWKAAMRMFLPQCFVLNLREVNQSFILQSILTGT